MRHFLIVLALVALAGCSDPPASPTSPAAPGGSASGGPPPTDTPAQTTPSGLRYHDLVVGSGEPLKPGNVAVVHYHGWLTDGSTFDASRQRGQPFEFRPGKGEVIKAWDEGVASMRVGGVRRLIAPPELAYGARSPSPRIPPNSTLIFDVELLAQKPGN